MEKKFYGPFGAGEVSKLTGLPHGTLDYYDRTEFITPSVRRADRPGAGGRRLYSFNDVVQLKVAKRLKDAGISLQQLRKVQDYLKKFDFTQPFAELYLVTDGRDVFTKYGQELLSLLKDPGQQVFAWTILDLSATVEEAEKEVERLFFTA